MARRPVLERTPWPLIAALFVATSADTAAQGLIGAGELSELPVPGADARVAYGDDAFQFGDLYLPAGLGKHPVLAFIHGGCFLSAFNLDHAAGLARAIADRGYAVWSIEYRRVGDEGGGWPNTFKDVGMGLDHLRDVAIEYSLDIGRVVVSGHSAGGTLALWAAGRDKIDEGSELWTAEPLDVHAVLGLAAVGDLEAAQMNGACGNVVDRLMGGTPVQVPERYAAGSPMQLAPITEPVQLVVGLLDRAWTPASVSYLYRAIAVGADRIDLVELPESGHFEMIVPTTESFQRVADAVEASFREIASRN